jgi:hypothetical protein
MNELSFHGQFRSTSDFYSSVEALVEIRQAIRRAGKELFCHRDLAHAQVTAKLVMAQAIQGMSRAKQQAWIQWLTRVGPYWVDERRHGDDDWLESDDGTIVTDCAIGEAAFCLLHGLLRETVSVAPSRWLYDPIAVIWRKSDDSKAAVNVPNHWTVDSVEKTLRAFALSFDSWRSLEEHSRRAYDKLTFADNAFAPLEGQPYAHGAAERLYIRLGVLNKMLQCFDKAGERTAEGNDLYAKHFVGEKAWFTDSSDLEKAEFKEDLTFPHPGKPGQYLFCTWHGKVKTPQLRIHFSWPIAAKTPLYVVYVGPKITKQ